MPAPKRHQFDPSSIGDITVRLNFFRQLQTVTNKIHATMHIDEIMLELSQDICALFNCDRLTIYAVDPDKTSIVSKVKTGLNSFKDLHLPINDQSIAGYAAMSRRIINIADVYDEAELRAIHPNLHFLSDVDRRTGYRTRQMLASAVVDEESGELLGVVQVINNRTGEPFSQVADEGIKGLCETLAIAFSQRNKAPAQVRSKYDHLVTNAVVSAEELDLARRSARLKHLDIEDILIDDMQASAAALGDALAHFFAVPYEPYRPERIKPVGLLRNLKRDYLEQNVWVPIEENGDTIVVLTLDPEQVKSSRVVNNVFPRGRLEYRVTTNREFLQTLDRFFRDDMDATMSVGDLLSRLDDGEDAEAPADAASVAADNELVKLVNRIIVDAYNQGASDIHIEPRPGKDKTLVRFRKDGSLVPYIEIPAHYRNAIAVRIKIMCDLDISERRKPQDGKIKFKRFGPVDIELRVATIPSAGGVEDVVMRILSAGEPMPLDKLDVLPHNLERLKAVIAKPYGLFFVCGPTGSGKTTTLHSVLAVLNTPSTKIWTAEDPVEITQKGLRQVQVNKKAGLDFATIMRSFLRADPDVIMVGEMRDGETSAIAIEASLTGHLVLATLHTNSAPESIVRLLDMGMDPFNFADALLGVLAQRLAKRLCTHCREAYVATAEDVQIFVEEYCEELRATPPFRQDAAAAHEAARRELLGKYGNEQGQIQFHRPHGCRECDETGYRGRIGLHELMVGSEHVKRLVQEHAHVPELFAAAIDEGMRTLKMDGMEKVLQGLTDMKQVRAVCIR